MDDPRTSEKQTKSWNPWRQLKDQSGKLGWIFLWLIGVPIPILLILYVLRGCT